MERKTKSKINKIFTASIILFPILNSAHIGDINFGIGDIFLIVTYMLVLLLHGRGIKPKVNKESFLFWLYIIYLGFISFVNCFTISDFEFSSMLMPLVRYTFYGLIIFSQKECVDYKIPTLGQMYLD